MMQINALGVIWLSTVLIVVNFASIRGDDLESKQASTDAAIGQLIEMGAFVGTADIDGKEAVVNVSFPHPKRFPPDLSLDEVLALLRPFDELRELDFWRDNQTKQGLSVLRNFKHLQRLDLFIREPLN